MHLHVRGWVVALLIIAWSPSKATPTAKPANAYDERAKALAALGAALQPILEIGPGPERTQRACSSLDALQTAANGVPRKSSRGSSLDTTTWDSIRSGVTLTVRDLAKACKASDKKIVDALGKVRTAEQEVADLEAALAKLVDASKPRALPQAMKNFDAVLRRLWGDKRRKGACEATEQMRKLIASVPANAPAGVNADKWHEAYSTITGSLNDMGPHHTCEDPLDGEDYFNTSLQQVHDSFYDLVLLFPIEKK